MSVDNDDDDTNSKDVEVDIGETLIMLDRLVNLKYLSKEEHDHSVVDI